MAASRFPIRPGSSMDAAPPSFLTAAWRMKATDQQSRSPDGPVILAHSPGNRGHKGSVTPVGSSGETAQPGGLMPCRNRDDRQASTPTEHRTRFASSAF